MAVPERTEIRVLKLSLKEPCCSYRSVFYLLHAFNLVMLYSAQNDDPSIAAEVRDPE